MNMVTKYSLLAFPLAFFGIPIYIYLPNFLSEYYGMDLGNIGAILFLTRLLDAIYDPIIGFISDKYSLSSKSSMIFFAIFLGIIFNCFFYIPKEVALIYQYVSLAVITILTYIIFSLLYINYYNLGTKITGKSQNYISSKREGMVFLGIIFASILPPLLSNIEVIFAYRIYGLVFLLIILFSSIIFPNIQNRVKIDSKFNLRKSMLILIKDNVTRNLLILFFINSIPVSITSNLLIFYLEEVLQANNLIGFFLLIYFVFAALGAVFFGKFSQKYHRINILLLSMILASTAFCFTIFLSKELYKYFYIICIMSGFAVGLEMSILPSLASDIINSKKIPGNSFFGIWTSLYKISLAFAAGIFLPLISKIDTIFINLAKDTKIMILYTIIPLIIKIGVIIFTYKSYKKGLLK